MARRKRHIHITPARKRKPDYRKLSAALQAYIAAQAEVDAEADYAKRNKPPRRGKS